MAQIPENIMNISQQFVNKIKKEIPVSKAVLFGSYVNGNYNEGRDVYLSIFSDAFEDMTRVEGITFLLIRALEYDIDLEPVAFSTKEMEIRSGIVDEIFRTGVEIV
jgi:hypothetical protein